MNITGTQIRAARAVLNWTVARLSEEANVGLSTIQRIEDVDGDPSVASTLQWRTDARDEAIAKVKAALESAGITFRQNNISWRS